MGSGGTLAEPLETNHGLEVKHPCSAVVWMPIKP